MILGLDYSYDWARVRVSELRLTYQFVMRYLTWPWDGRSAKKLSVTELATLRANGIIVGLNWEYKIGDQRAGAAGGQSDGTEAVRQAKELGYPDGCAIYFSTDFDAQTADLPIIQAYLLNARIVLAAAGYRLGQYGSYRVINWALTSGLIDVGWQTYAWSGGQWDSRAAIRQVRNNTTVAGGTVDIDEMHNEAYLWNYC